MKPLPLKPPHYRTSEQVRVGISNAYSGVFNPRGLEKIWYGPYGHMLCDLASPYNGHIIAQCQYPLWIPSFFATELKLRKDFEENNVDYDMATDMGLAEAGEEELSDDDEENDNSDEEDFLPPDIASVPGESRARSERVVELVAKRVLTAEQERKNLVKGLLERRAALFDQNLDIYDRTKGNPNVSLTSAASQADLAALDEEPDFVLSHVAHYELPLPDPETPEASLHYEHRAGLKVFHQCCPLIAELKPSPPRFFAGNTRDVAVLSALRSAQDDLMEYCSAYFKCNSGAESVIALAGAGPFWIWANILRTNVPEFDWRTKTMAMMTDPKEAIFRDMFGLKHFTLGTLESDLELSRISQDWIWPTLNDDHYKVVTP